MALNIKNAEVEQLADELARFSNTTKTEAIRQALLERKERTSAFATHSGREQRLRQFLETRVWPTIPAQARRPWTRDEEDAALGYGESGEPV
ncbi:MAG: Rv0623 family protein transcription factor [Bryobacterales bacterium]|jgi:antitoxin VapB|nr:Rv0623 family protein transcription factor [Bryobacterales bacterium]